MSSKIFYFSGTGNSLAVAKEPNYKFSDKGSIIPLSIFTNEESVEIDTDVLGFVLPVHFMNIPDIVKSFIKKLTFKTDPYIFAVATCNGISGASLVELNKYLDRKGKALSSGFVIYMPGNALVTPHNIEIERLNNYKAKATEISININNRSINNIEGKDSLKSRTVSAICKSMGKYLYLTPKNVSYTSQCVGCGICEKVCHLNNIKMVNKRSHWGKNCSTCLACFHWCPNKAVKGGKMLNKRAQYHHPEVSIEDMDLKNKILNSDL
ncbi:EFR1 family ferrodoxin [Clostridium sp. C8-1-8]|uniref:EFR1 family ferrodoxin n=1 Tax=Clostridium sp. C8-1-8 TaxID=2698831 RepID=UPI00136D9910|nr:EFR1 family ferrodoxin [Clostridium sp. C8-1-8]